MRIEIRNDSVLLDGYVNAIARDSKPMLDDHGEKFVEQISPKTFQRALEKSDDVLCLLNHEPSRILGSTRQGNVELFEDNIGLRAICKITDGEVIEKAKNGKLRGWSFGFEALKEHEEPLENGLKRRFVDEMNLAEVSIIDEHQRDAGSEPRVLVSEDNKIKARGGRKFRPDAHWPYIENPFLLRAFFQCVAAQDKPRERLYKIYSCSVAQYAKRVK